MKGGGTKAPLYVLDGYSIIYRSYFAFINRPLFSPDGRNTSAEFGFFKTLLNIYGEHHPPYFAVAMDSITPTFRHKRYPEYKATRDKTPEDLHSQIPIIEEICKALGVSLFRVDGFEADDLMATAAEICRKEGRPCYIISGDKDLLQVVGGPVKVLRPEDSGYSEVDADGVMERLGVRPEQIIDYLSLIGDSSDNIPGVRGIGPKTAVTLLKKYGDLDSIYKHLNELTKGQRTKLEENRENAYLSRELVVLKRDVPLPLTLKDFKVTSFSSKQAAPLLVKEGMNSILEQLGVDPSKEGPGQASGTGGLRKDETAGVNKSAEVGRGEVGEQNASGQGDLFSEDAYTVSAAEKGEYQVVLNEEDLKVWVEKVKKAKWFAFDSETDGLDTLTASPVGFSLAVTSGEACYIPIKAAGAVCLPEDVIKIAMKEILEDPELRCIGQNIKFDYKICYQWGVTIANISFDTMIAAWLLDSQSGSFGMDNLSERYLGYRTVHFSDLVKKGQFFHDVDIEQAGEYAAEDADITFRLYELFAEQLKRRKLESLFYDVEMPLVKVLARMELAGIGVSKKELEKYNRELTKELTRIEDEVFTTVGETFNINSTQQLQEILFVKRKLTPVKKTKTGYSTDTSVLEVLAQEDPVPEMVLRHRSLSKLRSTYVEALPKLINDATGRIHTHFIQTGTATGRLSCRDPNLQNLPIKTEEGRKIRSAFIASPGRTFVSADYSQIELVVLAHLSEDENLTEAFLAGEDIHRRTGSLIFGVPTDKVSSEERRIAKTINFGVMYGMGAFRLSNELGIPRKEAEEFIHTYFTRYAGVKAFIDRTIAEAEKKGFVTTLLGRERRIYAINSKNKTEKRGAERITVNTPIQGTAADIMKLAMLRISRRIEKECQKKKELDLRLLLQVHDELIFEAALDDLEWTKKMVEEEMVQAVSLKVPLRVTIETGDSWGEFH